MENVKLVFGSTERSNTNHELVAHANCFNEIFIEISDADNPEDFYSSQYIAISKETAIRLVRQLKKEIGTLINE